MADVNPDCTCRPTTRRLPHNTACARYDKDRAWSIDDRVEQARFRAEVPRLNGPMVARLRECAADTSPNWDGKTTVYPPEARELIALIDAAIARGQVRCG